MTTYQDILNAAQHLSDAERAQLLDALWSKTSPSDWSPPGQAWLEAANKRSEAYDAGEMTADSWDQVRQRARKQAGLDE